MPDDPLLEEYKILQAKIDKIGDYRFVIKGWSATIVIGLALGSTAANVPPFILLFGILVVGLFWLMEQNQKSLQKVLGKRAAALERAYDSPEAKVYREAKPFGRPIGLVPGIASAVIQSTHQSRGLRRIAIVLSDRLFYLLQALLLLVAFLFYWGAAKPPSGAVYNISYGADSVTPPAATPAAQGSKTDATTAAQPGAEQKPAHRKSARRTPGAAQRN